MRVLGHDPERRDRHLQERVGIVLQSSGFYPRVTVREAVSHFAKAYPAPRDPEDTITLVGLDEKADARTKDLSGGQRRRLDLALALIGDPDLIFLDEPTTGFDPEARRTAWGVVRRLRDLGKTVLLTTHYLEEAQELADRVAIVKDGRIVAEGPPDSLGPESSRYRVAYLSDGRRVEHQTDDPTELLHRLTRDALARGERLDGLEVTRPTLEEVYLDLTRKGDAGSYEPDRPGLGAVPLRAQAVLAQPERRVLQLRAAAAAARADCERVLEPTRRARRADPWHRRHGRAGHDVHLAGVQHHDPARRGGAEALARHADARGVVHGWAARVRRHERVRCRS